MIPVHLTNSGPKNIAIISFKPHNTCNFTCDYCCPTLNSGSERWNSNYKPVVDFVNQVRKKNNYAYLEILGGEPTMWPDLQAFINEVSHENLIIELNTNGSRTIRYWEEFKSGNNIMLFSWHSKESNTEHMFRVIDVMKNKSFAVATVLITPDSWEKGIAAIEKFEKTNVLVDVKPVRKYIGHHDLYPYTTEQLEYIKKYQTKSEIIFPKWLNLYPKDIILNGNKKEWHSMVIEKKITFTNWKCNAGIDRFTIDPNGDIYRCWPKVGGMIGNIYIGYKLPTEPVICTYESPCHCKIDAITEKWSPNYV